MWIQRSTLAITGVRTVPSILLSKYLAYSALLIRNWFSERLEAFTVIQSQAPVFWVVTPCSYMISYHIATTAV